MHASHMKNDVFRYTQHVGNPGPVFGAQDHWVGLAIFFDTYSNVKQARQGLGACDDSCMRAESSAVRVDDAERRHQGLQPRAGVP